jgi:hypothetical protein
VEGKDNSKPGYVNKNTSKFNVSYQVIYEVSDTVVDWRSYEVRGGRNVCNTAPCYSLSSQEQM